jgi:DNA-binding GntR family transcriptional regulator
MARRTITEAIFYEVRFAILNGQYLPGQILDRDELCQLYACKSAIVVDALGTLMAEGYLDVPRRGVFGVRHWTSDEIDDLLDIRASMVSLAVSRAVERASEGDIAKLNKCLLSPIDANLSDPEIAEQAYVAHIHFQSELIRKSGVSTIIDMARSMGPQALGRRAFWAQTLQEFQASLDALRAVHSAIGKRVVKSAVKGMADYVSLIRRPLLRSIAEQESEKVAEYPKLARIECRATRAGRQFDEGDREPGLDGRIIPFGSGRMRQNSGS